MYYVPTAIVSLHMQFFLKYFIRFIPSESFTVHRFVYCWQRTWISLERPTITYQIKHS